MVLGLLRADDGVPVYVREAVRTDASGRFATVVEIPGRTPPGRYRLVAAVDDPRGRYAPALSDPDLVELLGD